MNQEQTAQPNNAPQQNQTSAKEKLIYGAGCIYELTKWIIGLVVIITLVHFFVVTVAVVDGVSMEPNFHTDEIVLLDRWNYNFGKPERGDAVVLKFPGDPEHKKYIKRIIGMPGEHIQIQNNQVLINGKVLNESYIPSTTLTDSPSRVIDETIKSDEYFVMGDNRQNSNDSRVWDTAGRRFLIGRAWLKVWPVQEIIPEPKY